jgi:N-acetylglucosaminyldiphosphoundecaprenol N-acetyl-beta-D-mannosaminyltransferase
MRQGYNMTESFFGYTIWNESQDQCFANLDALVKSPGFHRVVTINPQMVAGAESDPLLKTWIKEADIIVADGVGIKWSGRLLHGYNLPVITGMSLVKLLLEMNCYSFYFVGATQHTIEKAVLFCENNYPGSKILGSHHGFFSAEKNKEINDDIIEKSPDFIFVGLGFPKQEYFIQYLSLTATRGIAIGVGGVFDVLSGNKRLAPNFFREWGLEWLYRGLQEPSRMRRWGFLFRYVFLVVKRYLSS